MHSVHVCSFLLQMYYYSTLASDNWHRRSLTPLHLPRSQWIKSEDKANDLFSLVVVIALGSFSAVFGLQEGHLAWKKASPKVLFLEQMDEQNTGQPADQGPLENGGESDVSLFMRSGYVVTW